MSYLLHIDSSSAGANSISRQVAQTFRDAWRGQVVYRDLAASPAPHITADGITARFTDPAGRDPGQAAAAAIQDELVGSSSAWGPTCSRCRCTTTRCPRC